MTRDALAAAFLAKHGFAEASLGPRSADASFRSYRRLTGGPYPALLMDAPPDKEDVRPFLVIAGLLRQWGFHAPRILARDIATGLLLLEDLGDDRFSLVITRMPERETALYESAVDLLLALHDRVPPRRVATPEKSGTAWLLAPYDMEALMAELHLFTDWYLPAINPGSEASHWRAQLDPLWLELLEGVHADQTVLTLRDYHADNLMWLPEGMGLERIGLLDFQDALIGHPAYDLVSLLQDSRRDIAPGLEAAMLARYFAGRRRVGEPFNEAAFLRDYRILGAQRSAKVIGIFTRLARRDGKPAYLQHLPRVWRRLMGNLAAGGFSALEGALDRLVPRAERGAPPCL